LFSLLFGGPGPDGTEQMYKIDMHRAPRQAFAAGLTETAGGALLAAGLATPLTPARPR
jgi:putative oxidoreductase